MSVESSVSRRLAPLAEEESTHIPCSVLFTLCITSTLRQYATRVPKHHEAVNSRPPATMLHFDRACAPRSSNACRAASAQGIAHRVQGVSHEYAWCGDT